MLICTSGDNSLPPLIDSFDAGAHALIFATDFLERNLRRAASPIDSSYRCGQCQKAASFGLAAIRLPPQRNPHVSFGTGDAHVLQSHFAGNTRTVIRANPPLERRLTPVRGPPPLPGEQPSAWPIASWTWPTAAPTSPARKHVAAQLRNSITLRNSRNETARQSFSTFGRCP